MARNSGTNLFLLLLAAAAAGGAWWWWRSRQPALEELTTTAQKLPLPAGAIMNIPATGHGARPSTIKPNPWVTPAAGQKFESLFVSASQRYGIPPGLLSRMAKHESNYNVAARGTSGEIGIMQIMPNLHPEVGKEGAADPARAIPYAAKFLRSLFDQFKSWTLAVAAYNAGAGNVRKYGGVPPFPVTKNYVATVLPAVGISQPESGVRYA